MEFNKLREIHEYCSFNSFDIEENEDSYVVTYNFLIDKLDSFKTTWTFKKHDVPYFNKDNLLYRQMLFDLGMVELISYYKLTCAKKIKIECGSLSKEQANFYQKLIFNGLGEFLYRNDIDVEMDELCTFENLTDKTVVISNNASYEGVLLPIGGGKDSITSIEILRKDSYKIVPFMINGRGATIETCVVAQYKNDEYIDVKRRLDKKIIEYNKQGYLNGHIPFSSVVAFAAQFVAACNHLKYIVLSNEDSANESTVIGKNVNHQYSKSFEFENDFRAYNFNLYENVPNYFSLLRPFSEYQIGKYFAKCKAYYPIFRSCNLGSKEDKWCNNCAKCLYVYILLSAFITPVEMEEIFKDNLLNREDLLEIFHELIGERDEKPFECVGSIEEINFAIIDGIEYYRSNNLEMPLMYKVYCELPLFEKMSQKENPYKLFYNEKNNVPVEFVDLLRREMMNDD